MAISVTAVSEKNKINLLFVTNYQSSALKIDVGSKFLLSPQREEGFVTSS